jgi:hypothetical protein
MRVLRTVANSLMMPLRRANRAVRMAPLPSTDWAPLRRRGEPMALRLHPIAQGACGAEARSRRHALSDGGDRVNEGLPAVCELWQASRIDIASSPQVLPGIALGRIASEAHPDSNSRSGPQLTSGGVRWTQAGARRTARLRVPTRSAIASETSSGRGNPAGSSGDHGPIGSIPSWFGLCQPRSMPSVRSELGASGRESSPLTTAREREGERPGTNQDDETNLRSEPELVDKRQFPRSPPTRDLTKLANARPHGASMLRSCHRAIAACMGSDRLLGSRPNTHRAAAARAKRLGAGFR